MNSLKILARDKEISSYKLLVTGYQSGFTFIEVIIVLSIVLVFAGLGLFLSFDTLRSNTFEADVEAAVTTILRARSKSVNNINQSTYGFRVDDAANEYVLFEAGGPEERISFSPELLFSGANQFVFTQLTGELVGPVPPLPLTIIQEGKTADIYVNSEGRVDWEIDYD